MSFALRVVGIGYFVFSVAACVGAVAWFPWGLLLLLPAFGFAVMGVLAWVVAVGLDEVEEGES